jgi:hypothetical protein
MDWNIFTDKLYSKYGIDDDINHILFMIGINERGEGYQERYSKEEKMDLIRLAKGTLLEKDGFYLKDGISEDGWPEFKKLKDIDPAKENDILRELIIDYFREYMDIE